MKEAFEKIIERLEEIQHIEFYFDGRPPKQSIDFVDAIEIVKEVAEECKSLTVEQKSLTEKFNDGWIPCSERLPNREEFIQNDGRFIVTDGNRTYQSIYDIYKGVFATINMQYAEWHFTQDNCVIAWQPLPPSYKPKEK